MIKAKMEIDFGRGMSLFRQALVTRQGASNDCVKDDGVILVSESEKTSCWRTEREALGFRFSRFPDDTAVLRAGWYRLELDLRSQEPSALSPSLYITYKDGTDGDPIIMLPEPGIQGKISVLVLFKSPVKYLKLSPCRGCGKFSLGLLRISSLSRFSALFLMLKMNGNFSVLGNFFKYIADARALGLSGATSLLHEKYIREKLPQLGDKYGEWIDRFDSNVVASEVADTSRFQSPLISILVPCYETPQRLLKRCVESLVGQSFVNFQACFVDDASTSDVGGMLSACVNQNDSRFVFVRRGNNGHISAASNSALALARGKFVAFLDHDDELHPSALAEMAAAIRNNPDAKFFYSDEDKLDRNARRFDPYFKPEFDIDLLRGQNYISHFTVIDADLVREVGGFREGYEGSQDHDLFLRCIERVKPDQIVHVPKVLYHWRAVEGSTATGVSAKSYATDAGLRAVNDHLQRLSTGASAESLPHGHFRVRWPLPKKLPKVSIIIPTKDKAELLRRCVESIFEKSSYSAWEILIVDNGSSERSTLDYLKRVSEYDQVRVLRDDGPFNYSRLNNQAVGIATGSVLALVNNDIEVISDDWLEELVSHAIRTDVGVVGAMLYYPNDTIQHAGVILGIGGVAGHVHVGMPRGYGGPGGRARLVQSMSAVTGACLVVRRSVYEEVGGLDESLAVAFNDVDFCLRVRLAGYRNVWTPFAELYHHESASRGYEDTEEKKQRFQGEARRMLERWGEVLIADPAYNPNLSLESQQFELAVPPRR